VLGEEPSDAELDEMIALLGGEGDGQISYDDFLEMFSATSPVLAEMLTQAPAPEQEEEVAVLDQAEVLRAAAGEGADMGSQDIGLLLKAGAGFMHGLVKKNTGDNRRQIMPHPKAKLPGQNRARPVPRSNLASGLAPGDRVGLLGIPVDPHGKPANAMGGAAASSASDPLLGLKPGEDKSGPVVDATMMTFAEYQRMRMHETRLEAERKAAEKALYN
ncbi:unnamed protein product, partial [Polarella glacialis]